ncbi:MAG: hypothetical protein AAF693_21400 [Bacteroidota bacterium]
MRKVLISNLIRIQIVLFVAITVFGCTDDEPEEITVDTNAGEITATINGASFRSFGVSSTAFVEDFGLGDQLVIGGIDVSNLNRLNGVSIVLIMPDFSQLSAGNTFSGSSMDMLMTAGYAIDLGGDDPLGATAELVASTTGTITAIDRSNRLVSGTFSYDAIDEDTGDVYEVRNGVFTQIQYERLASSLTKLNKASI